MDITLSTVANGNLGILVTGTHRSGSTWLGRSLCISKSFGYIHEPFNLLTRPGVCEARFRYWFTYITEENAHRYIDPLRATLQFRYSPWAEVRAIRRAKDGARMLRDWYRMENCRRRGKRPVVKDPIAFFSAPWLSDHLNLQVVLLARHPAAFVASLKRVGWSHPFSHFRDQPSLMEELQPYADAIIQFAESPQSVVEQGILLWNLVHYKMKQWHSERPGWVFVRHEDLSSDPTGQIPSLVRSLGGVWGQSDNARLLRLTTGTDGESTPDNPSRLRRNSSALVSSWQKTLTSQEVERIKRGTGDVAAHFYSDESWCMT